MYTAHKKLKFEIFGKYIIGRKNYTNKIILKNDKNK